jgi:two-component system sensor histidine kinase ChiS
MTYLKATKVKLFILFLATFIAVVSLIYGSNDIKKLNKAAPFVKDGIIDLRDWDFKKDGIINLDGQWEFYNNQILSPEDFNKGTNRIKSYSSIPGVYADHGYGTYRLKMLVNDISDVYSIKVEFLQSAYKLWANDYEVITVGKVGKDEKDMKPQLVPMSGSFAVQAEEVYLTLQVSNFYSKMGLIDTIVIGRSSQIESGVRKQLAFDLFIFGSTLMAALYNLGLFLRRRKNKSTLYFAVVCIIVAIRTLFLGERFIITIFPDFNYIAAGKIMHWTFYLYIPFIVLFINSFYNEILSKWVVKAAIISVYMYGLLVFIIKPQYYMNLILPFEVMTELILVYMILKISMLYIRNSSSDYIMVIGLFALLITRMNDILYEYSIILTGSFAPFGTLIFIIANSYLLAERQSTAVNTAEEMSQKLESLNNLKDEFLAVTSHELKTPLNGIIGLSEILNYNSSSNLSKDEKQNLSLINTSAKRLSNLVDDIMVFSRLKNNEIKLKKSSIDIGKLAESVAKFFKLTINNKHISIVNLIDSDTPQVFGDEERVEQIFFNIVGNAVKFTSQGSITLFYNIKGDFLEVNIEDTGIGIPEHKLKNIFEIYEQVEGISEKYGGTGLGLYITKKLVELHGGTIGVTSSAGKGSKFSFALPLCRMNNTIESYIDKVENEDLNFKTKENEYENKDAHQEINSEYIFEEKEIYKVLIVDDEYVNQRVLERYLSKEKFTTLCASTGREALRVLENNKDLDLVILDMMMPDLLGCEVSSVIREKYSLFELPILIMTANSSVDNLVLSFESGANDYLAKPFNQHEFLARVNTLLSLKKSVEQALKLTQQVTKAREQVEELKEQDKLKTEFFANMSHELRTPLNVICGTIQLLDSLDGRKNLGDERIKYYLKIMNQNSLRLLRLINNIIDMTKIEGDYLNLNLTNGDIVYVVEEISQSVAEYIKAQNISLVFDTEIEEKVMPFDEEKLERIILNILSNAIKFTPRNGSIYVNIYDKGQFVEISIKDTGIGIPEDKLEFIFERFAQLDKSLSRKNEGSGIGLSLVKSLVEMHGGKISVKSKVGVGTEFIISLPIRELDTAELENSIVYKQVKESKYEKNLPMEFSDIYM